MCGQSARQALAEASGLASGGPWPPRGAHGPRHGTMCGQLPHNRPGLRWWVACHQGCTAYPRCLDLRHSKRRCSPALPLPPQPPLPHFPQTPWPRPLPSADPSLSCMPVCQPLSQCRLRSWVAQRCRPCPRYLCLHTTSPHILHSLAPSPGPRLPSFCLRPSFPSLLAYRWPFWVQAPQYLGSWQCCCIPSQPGT